MTQATFDLFGSSIRTRFEEFDRDHPEVYRALVRLAREWIAAGHGRLGIATLFERLRWEWHVAGLTDRAGFKLNNSYRALYARKLMAENTDLDGLFEIRTLTSSNL